MRKSYRAHHIVTPKGGRVAARTRSKVKGTLAALHTQGRPDALAMLQALPLRGVERGLRKRVKHARKRKRDRAQ